MYQQHFTCPDCKHEAVIVYMDVHDMLDLSGETECVKCDGRMKPTEKT